MKEIVAFQLASGDRILVEVDEPVPTDSRTASRISIGDRAVVQAQESFEKALDKIKPVADAILTRVQNLNQPADEVEVKFGIKLSAQLGAIIASGSGEVNYEITLKWKKESENVSTT